jgi:hypothetical protein
MNDECGAGNTNCQRTVALTHPACANTSAFNGASCQELAAQKCLDAGTDVEIGSTVPDYAAKAVAAGLLPATALARSNARVYEQAILQVRWEKRSAYRFCALFFTTGRDHYWRTAPN